MKALTAVLTVLLTAAAGANEIKLDAGWRFTPGDDMNYAKADLDDGAWRPIKVPAYWKRAGFTGIDKLGWYRCKFTLPEGAGKPLELTIGGISRCDETYFNGQLVGRTGDFGDKFSNHKYVRRTYDIAPELVKDENVIAIRVFAGEEAAGGGIIKPVSLREIEYGDAFRISHRMSAKGFYYAPGEKFSYRIVCFNRWSEARKIVIESIVRDYRGTVIKKFSDTIAVEGGKEVELEKTLELPLNGIYAIESGVIENGKLTNPSSIKIAILPEITTAADSDHRFGTAAHLNWWEEAAVVKSLNVMARAGIGSVRLGFIWGELEPSRGSLDFARTDLIVNEAAKYGITVLPTLSGVPPWAETKKSQNKRMEIPQAGDWTAFVRTVVSRYRDKIPAWEIANEPNHNKLTPMEYCAILNPAYATAKEVAPECEILIGGLSSVHVKAPGRVLAGVYLKELLKAGAKFDSIAFHPYVGWPKFNTRIASEFTDAIKEVDDAAGQDKKIHLTEYSSSVRADQGRSELDQARFLVVSTVTALTLKNTGNVYWYNFRNKGVDPKDNEMNYGLINFDFSPKTALVAYHALISQLKHLKFSENWNNAPDGVTGYIFGGKERKVLVAWTDSGTRSIAVPGAVCAVDLVGAPAEIEADKVWISELPTYITLTEIKEKQR